MTVLVRTVWLVAAGAALLAPGCRSTRPTPPPPAVPEVAAPTVPREAVRPSPASEGPPPGGRTAGDRPAAPGAAGKPSPSRSGARGDTLPAAPSDTTPRPVSASRPAIDASAAIRLEIVSVGDSTIAFLAPAMPWVRGGSAGIAVDPRRRDLLVARFSVVERRADTAVAVVTGQTMRPTLDHVALVERPPPPRPPSRKRPFWAGFGIGGLFGVLAALLVD